MTTDEEPVDAPWLVYVLRCEGDRLYCGISNRVDTRLAAHVAGKGARFTRAYKPVEVVLCWFAGTRGDALREELWFKGLSRAQKDALVSDAVPVPL